MGDFYELFYEDAETAAARARPDADQPRQGAEPDADGRLSAPLSSSRTWPSSSQAGQRAAVCEQVEDPKLAKGLVKREVVRVVTPGTLTDDALLDPQGRQLPGGRRRGRRQARPGLGRALDRPVHADGRLADRAGRRAGPARPGRDPGLGDEPRRPLGPRPARRIRRWRSRRGRRGTSSPSQARATLFEHFGDDHAGRLRLRRRRRSRSRPPGPCSPTCARRRRRRSAT